MNPNNCATCDYKRHPDGGWCYMFRDEPTGVCMQHTRRAAEDREIARTAPAWWTGADVSQTELPPLPPYIYGREAGPNEKLLTLPVAQEYARTALAAERVRADAAERDARRYRWLRDVGDATWRPFGLREGCSAALADAAIDAAIDAATEGVQHGEAK